ncbi:hypothetical protein PoB_000260300 [Plakobranchus ocellatus]|uniref:Uncharacterized protein n=1 Tax=Plakobranchus ocellatus TaxID=259542 RepID=A0AAV3Y0B9_9GAST|nr:hypothetical protein PoB_000260300 [Plakobranchus ocellatus]
MPYAKNNQDPIPGLTMLELSVGQIKQIYIDQDPKVGFLYIASPQQGDLRLSGRPSGQGVRSVPADLRADSLPTMPTTPRSRSIRSNLANFPHKYLSTIQIIARYRNLEQTLSRI